MERERGRIAQKEPLPEAGGATVVAKIVPEVLRRLGLEDQEWLGQLGDEWSKLAGDAVAKHSRPGRVQQGNLVVFVDSSVWLSELARYGKAVLLANVQKRFGNERIKSVSFQLDPG